MYGKLLEGPLFYNLWSSIHFHPRYKAIQQVINTHHYPHILDLGCGTGLLKRYHPNCHYVGIDTNIRYIEYAKKNLTGTFIVGDILELKKYVDSNTFDFIILNGVLHHLDDSCVANLLKSLDSIMSRSGKIIIIDHIYKNDLNLINKILLKFDRGTFSRQVAEYYNLFRQFTMVSFTQFFIKAGPLVLWTQGRFVLASP